MRIAFYTPTLTVGGYEKVVLGYANAMAIEHEIFILCGKAQGALLTEVHENVIVVDFGVRARGIFSALRKWLSHNQIDILYVPFITFTLLAVAAKYFAGSNALIYSAQHGFEKRYPACFERLLGKFVKRANVLAAVSSAVADYDAKRLHIPRDRYYILDNPVIDSRIPVTEASCGWMTSNVDKPIFVTSGRLSYDKHIELALEIIAKVNEQEDARLLILGDGPERENLEKVAQKLHLSDKVCFAGYVKNPIGYLGKCMALMQMSEIESFGNVVVEALYAGIPVITTNSGGPVEIIEGDRYGICIGAYNDEHVVSNGVNAVLGLLRGQRRFEGLREKALRYDSGSLKEQFLEPYYECVEKNQKKNSPGCC